MKKLLCLTFMALSVSGCVANVIGLRDPKTGEIAQCRRGFWGTNNTMDQCAAGYEAKGFKRMSEQEAETLPEPLSPEDAALQRAAATATPVQAAQPAFDPYARYVQPNAQPVMQPQMLPADVPPQPQAAMPAPAAKAEEEKPFFSQYPTSTQHKGYVLPDFLK